MLAARPCVGAEGAAKAPVMHYVRRWVAELPATSLDVPGRALRACRNRRRFSAFKTAAVSQKRF
eukprot:COSAG06_NODE_784_length_12328_cov_4.921416_15_plen_64_part_00